jgi:hypothetical protein
MARALVAISVGSAMSEVSPLSPIPAELLHAANRREDQKQTVPRLSFLLPSVALSSSNCGSQREGSMEVLGRQRSSAGVFCLALLAMSLADACASAAKIKGFFPAIRLHDPWG